MFIDPSSLLDGERSRSSQSGGRLLFFGRFFRTSPIAGPSRELPSSSSSSGFFENEDENENEDEDDAALSNCHGSLVRG